MSRRKSTRRRASLPLAPHVVASLRRVRHAFHVLNSVPLLDLPDDLKMSSFLEASHEFYRLTLAFSSALWCSVDDPTFTPSTANKE